MRRQQALAQPAAIEYFGGLPPSGVLGAEGFRDHDAAKAWDDHGQAQAIVENLLSAFCAQMKQYGAEQARDAVADYGETSYIDMAMIDGRASVVVDMSNKEAKFHVYWSLEDLLAQVAQQAIERGAEDMLSGIYEACSRAALMLEATPVPEPAPVAPPVRQAALPRGGKLAARPAVPQVRRAAPVRG